MKGLIRPIPKQGRPPTKYNKTRVPKHNIIIVIFCLFFLLFQMHDVNISVNIDDRQYVCHEKIQKQCEISNGKKKLQPKLIISIIVGI